MHPQTSPSCPWGIRVVKHSMTRRGAPCIIEGTLRLQKFHLNQNDNYFNWAVVGLHNHHIEGEFFAPRFAAANRREHARQSSMSN